MKLSLPLKLGIAVVLLFAAVITTCLLWTPVKMRYYLAEYYSNDAKKGAVAIKGMLACGERGRNEITALVEHDLRHSPDKRRIVVMDALILTGKPGIRILDNVLGCHSVDTAEYIAATWADNYMVEDNFSEFQFTSPEGYRLANELLVAKIPDVNKRDKEGHAPLHYKAMLGHKVAIARLIEKGADINAKDNIGATPLHVAVVVYQSKIVELLIGKGAEVNAVDFNGETPLDYAERELYEDKLTLKIKSFLRARGGKTGKELEASGVERQGSGVKEEKK